jgi:hypothetical protein
MEASGVEQRARAAARARDAPRAQTRQQAAAPREAQLLLSAHARSQRTSERTGLRKRRMEALSPCYAELCG